MFSKKELKLAYGLAICLLVGAALSYAAFPLERPEEPFRIMFKGDAGNSLFDHKTHTSELGYGLSCRDCHHELEDDDDKDVELCGECHDPVEGDEEVPNLADSFHLQCGGCHQEFEAGPIEAECTLCHLP